MMKNCEKFCKGGKNTSKGTMITLSFDLEVAKELGMKRDKDGNFSCPFGCTTNPQSGKATENAKVNSGLASICRRNIFRPYV